MFSAAPVCRFVVSLSVFCQHDNFRMIKRRMMKLGGYVHCTKISPSSSFKVKVKGEGHRKQKNEKVQHFVRKSSSGERFSCGIFFQERSSAARK